MDLAAQFYVIYADLDPQIGGHAITSTYNQGCKCKLVIVPTLARYMSFLCYAYIVLVFKVSLYLHVIGNFLIGLALYVRLDLDFLDVIC